MLLRHLRHCLTAITVREVPSGVPGTDHRLAAESERGVPWLVLRTHPKNSIQYVSKGEENYGR